MHSHQRKEALHVSIVSEKIDDRPQSAPSKRIQAVFPSYKKGRSDIAHGPRIAETLDLAKVRQRCPRFDAWVAKLEAL
jgi:hypothetical protein